MSKARVSGPAFPYSLLDIIEVCCNLVYFHRTPSLSKNIIVGVQVVQVGGAIGPCTLISVFFSLPTTRVGYAAAPRVDTDKIPH